MKCIQCNVMDSNKNSGLCNQCEKEEENKINGLLYIPALGIVANFIIGLLGFYTFASAFADMFIATGGITIQAVCFLLLMLANIIVTLIATWFFFKRLKQIKRIMVLYYVFGLLYALCLMVVRIILYGFSLKAPEMRTLISSILGVIIWLPYFLFSKRIPVVFNK